MAVVEDGRAGAARTDARVRAVARPAVVRRMEEEACLELVLDHARLAVAHDLDVVRCGEWGHSKCRAIASRVTVSVAIASRATVSVAIVSISPRRAPSSYYYHYYYYHYCNHHYHYYD